MPYNTGNASKTYIRHAGEVLREDLVGVVQHGLVRVHDLVAVLGVILGHVFLHVGDKLGEVGRIAPDLVANAVHEFGDALHLAQPQRVQLLGGRRHRREVPESSRQRYICVRGRGRWQSS